MTLCDKTVLRRARALTLLQQSYTSRDQVSVIPFCGDRAEVLLPPSKSIAMARKRMDSLPLRRRLSSCPWHLPGKSKSPYCEQLRDLLEPVLLQLICRCYAMMRPHISSTEWSCQMMRRGSHITVSLASVRMICPTAMAQL